MNSFNAADSEILCNRRAPFLTVSTDSIAIEIHSKLYQDPKTWGYMAVANSVSDLAVSGSQPVGMVISAQWKRAHEGKIQHQVYRSMAKTLRDFEIPLLGGDSGSSKETVITTTIIGESTTQPLSRKGLKTDDLILVFGKDLGIGPLLSYNFIRNEVSGPWESLFRPKPSWAATSKFRKYFHASIDSSDGLYNALETLSLINNVQFEIDLSSIKLNKQAATYILKQNLPIQFLIENDLGDLQTCVAITRRNYQKIKPMLPYHFVLAETQALKDKKFPVIYKGQKNRKPFSKILEKVKMNYTEALILWQSQYIPSHKDTQF
jgi:thiamine monophosphate kinase